MSWSGRGPDGRRGYHHGNLREALIQAALDLIAAQRLYCRPRSPASPRSCVLLLSRDCVLLPREPIGLETYCHRAQSGGQSRLHCGNASNVGFNRPLRPRLGPPKDNGVGLIVSPVSGYYTGDRPSPASQSGRRTGSLKLSVIVSVYNEVVSLSIILNRIVAAIPYVEKEIIVVDDCSTDRTAAGRARED